MEKKNLITPETADTIEDNLCRYAFQYNGRAVVNLLDVARVLGGLTESEQEPEDCTETDDDVPDTPITAELWHGIFQQVFLDGVDENYKPLAITHNGRTYIPADIVDSYVAGLFDD